LKLGIVLESDARLISGTKMQPGGSYTKIDGQTGGSSSLDKLSRLSFIDLTRGLVMILMAWDHVPEFWNKLLGGLEGSREQYGAHA